MTPETFEKASILHADRKRLSIIIRLLQREEKMLLVPEAVGSGDSLAGNLMPWIEIPENVRNLLLWQARHELADIDQQLKDL